MNVQNHHGGSGNRALVLKKTIRAVCMNATESYHFTQETCLVHSESKKLCHYTFIRNFGNCPPIFKILSLLHSPRNLQQNACHISHHTVGMSLHYTSLIRLIVYKVLKLHLD